LLSELFRSPIDLESRYDFTCLPSRLRLNEDTKQSGSFRDDRRPLNNDGGGVFDDRNRHALIDRDSFEPERSCQECRRCRGIAAGWRRRHVCIRNGARIRIAWDAGIEIGAAARQGGIVDSVWLESFATTDHAVTAEQQ
jgi:hypothetical protein